MAFTARATGNQALAAARRIFAALSDAGLTMLAFAVGIPVALLGAAWFLALMVIVALGPFVIAGWLLR